MLISSNVRDHVSRATSIDKVARVMGVVPGNVVVLVLVFGSKAFETRRPLDQRAVDREMLGAHQLLLARFLDDDAEELAGDVVLQRPLAVA
jgi:hypothetical protein